MARTHAFGPALARLRRERGFASAHAFYKGRDGRRVLGLTFRNYLNLEAGKSLPRPERLEAILTALGVDDRDPAARELAVSYFGSLGMGRLARLAGAGGTPAEASATAYVARQTLRRTAAQLTLKQMGLRARDFAANTCHVLLQNTAGGLTLSELARAGGLTPAEARRGVKALAAAGLAVEKGGRARSAFEGRSVSAPPRAPETAGVIAAFRGHQERWAADGKLLRNAVTLVRLRPDAVERFYRLLDELGDTLLVYDDPEPAEGSAIYMFRGQLHRLFSH